MDIHDLYDLKENRTHLCTRQGFELIQKCVDGGLAKGWNNFKEKIIELYQADKERCNKVIHRFSWAFTNNFKLCMRPGNLGYYIRENNIAIEDIEYDNISNSKLAEFQDLFTEELFNDYKTFMEIQLTNPVFGDIINHLSDEPIEKLKPVFDYFKNGGIRKLAEFLYRNDKLSHPEVRDGFGRGFSEGTLYIYTRELWGNRLFFEEIRTYFKMSFGNFREILRNVHVERPTFHRAEKDLQDIGALDLLNNIRRIRDTEKIQELAAPLPKNLRFYIEDSVVRNIKNYNGNVKQLKELKEKMSLKNIDYYETGLYIELGDAFRFLT